MSNYIYYQHQDVELNNRFTIETAVEGYTIRGLDIWQRLISRLLRVLSMERRQNTEAEQGIREETINDLMDVTKREDFNFYNWQSINPDSLTTEELVAVLLLIRLRYYYNPLPANSCPRLFISHRQIDKDYALRIARLAKTNKFACWVDVLDSDLQVLQRSRVSKRLLPLITACIIEMALINCTHVIACMTPNTRGSLWLPYEYGRVTKLPGYFKNATAWRHPNLVQKDFPEYMLLGECFTTEDEIESWLQEEWHRLGKNHCNPVGGDSIGFEGIRQLPTQADEEAEQQRREFEEWLCAGMPLLKSIRSPNVIKFKIKKPPKP